MGYNTRLVKPQDVPRSYEDLLQPRWSGNFGIEASDIIWFAAVAKAMGGEKRPRLFREAGGDEPQVPQRPYAYDRAGGQQARSRWC